MATMDIIIVVQNEPRDGDIVYALKDEAEYRARVREVICEEWEDDQIKLGQTYFEDASCVTIVGYEVALPFAVEVQADG